MKSGLIFYCNGFSTYPHGKKREIIAKLQKTALKQRYMGAYQDIGTPNSRQEKWLKCTDIIATCL